MGGTSHTARGGQAGADVSSGVKEAGSQWVSGLSTEEKSAIIDYTGEIPNYYRNINDTLRGKSSSFDSGNRERAIHIHEALSKASLPADTVLYRGGGDAILGAAAGKSDQEIIGTGFKDRGFVSTSLNPDEAFPGSTMLEIHAPAGSPAASIQSISKLPHEDEVLIDCGRIFVISDVRYEGGKRIVVVNLI